MAVTSMHAGDVTPTDTFRALSEDPDAVLVDVRTRAEWQYVGVPDLSRLGKQAVLIEWQRGDGAIDPGFVDRLKSAVPETAPVYFLCRSGARSAAAAAAATRAGYVAAHNVSHGFEGPPDRNRHRGAVAGWKVDGLPWVQG